MEGGTTRSTNFHPASKPHIDEMKFIIFLEYYKLNILRELTALQTKHYLFNAKNE